MGDTEEILSVDIDREMRQSYLDYAMSVITARALPDVRDGLKPVQRRILFAMRGLGLQADRPTRKSARIIGEVLGKYHPHGDSAVYDAMVRMAQDFSLRYPLVDGQGNFGSVDGDGAAAMRYTEARLSPVGEEMLKDIEKDTVDTVPNFDSTLSEPTVLPALLPNLLVNGVGGIAVGMATNIPPHNLSEIADAIAYLVDHYTQLDDVSVEDLMAFVPGPDFPTGALVLGNEGIKQAYATGKGRVICRARMHVEDLRSNKRIVVTELPYQVNKANLVERIATLVREGRVEGIADLRDESDRNGTRVIIDLRRGVEAAAVISPLLKYTQLRTTFGCNMLALVDGEPKVLSLKKILVAYIEHRHEVIVRRSEYELARARERAHILEGLLIALDNLDEVIATIRRSRTADTAQTNLRRKFKLSEDQARAILDMQLRRLAALERKRIETEYEEVLARIAYLEALLGSKAKVLALVKDDVLDLKKRYGDPRRTRICEAEHKGAKLEDLVPDDQRLLLLTRSGAVRSVKLGTPQARRSGTQAVAGMSNQESDVVRVACQANGKDTALFVGERGSAALLPAHRLPEVAQHPEGSPVHACAQLPRDERPVAMLPLPDLKDTGRLLVMGTRLGKVKRLQMADLAQIGAGGQVMGIADDDALGWALIASEEDEVIMVTAQAKSIRFAASEVRPQGLTAQGVMGIKLQDDDTVVAMELVRPQTELLVVTNQGYGKRTPLDQYSSQGRGGQGLLTMDASKIGDTGPIVAAGVVSAEDEVILTTAKGRMQRQSVKALPQLDRATWGRQVSQGDEGKAWALKNDTLDGCVRIDDSADDEQRPTPEQPEDEPEAPAPKATTRSSRRGTKTRSTSRPKPAKEEAAPADEGEAGSSSESAPPATRTRRATVTRRRTRRTSG
ncbi:MAG: DNA gyrase subunit A [Anaerolineae bacterium]|jgi:DNA gyrase subunit A